MAKDSPTQTPTIPINRTIKAMYALKRIVIYYVATTRSIKTRQTLNRINSINVLRDEACSIALTILPKSLLE